MNCIMVGMMVSWSWICGVVMIGIFDEFGIFIMIINIILDV